MKHFLILFLALSLQSCNGQKTEVTLKDLEFNSIFGTTKKDSTNVYCLLGTGFFKTPRSKNSDELIDDWISKNKDAKVVLVSTIVDGKANINYCWLVDSKDKTINEYLIQNVLMFDDQIIPYKPELIFDFGFSDLEKQKILNEFRNKN